MDEDDALKLAVGALIGATITFAVCYFKVEEAMKESVRKKEAWFVQAAGDFSLVAGPFLEKSEAEKVALEADFAVMLTSAFIHTNRANVPCASCIAEIGEQSCCPVAAHAFVAGRTRRWDPALYALDDAAELEEDGQEDDRQ